MNLNGYILFLMNMLDIIVRGWKYTKKSPLAAVTFFTLLESIVFCSISFPTSILIISHSVTFLLGYKKWDGKVINEWGGISAEVENLLKN